MSTTPVICFNTEPAQSGDYFNHDRIDEPLVLKEAGRNTINTGQTSEVSSVYMSHNLDDEITDVSFYLSPFTGATPASITGTETENFSITSGSNDSLVVKIDDRTFNYDVTLASGTGRTAQAICDDINFTIGEKIAEPDNGAVKLKSPSKGPDSKVYVFDCSAASVLGFPTNNNDPVAQGSTGNWGQQGNGSHGKSVGDPISYPVTIEAGVNDEIQVSLNYATAINVVIPAGTINDDSDFQSTMRTALTDAGFSLSTDMTAFASGGVLTLYSQSTEDNTSVRVFEATNDARPTIGMENPHETGTDYANASANDDYSEMIEWGDLSYGLELGQNTNWMRFHSGVGENAASAIPLTIGDGSANDALSIFDSNAGNGETQLKFRLSVPPDETETGYRETAVSVQFTYL